MEEDLEVGQLKCNKQKNTRQYCHTFPGAKVHIGSSVFLFGYTH